MINQFFETHEEIFVTKQLGRIAYPSGLSEEFYWR